MCVTEVRAGNRVTSAIKIPAISPLSSFLPDPIKISCHFKAWRVCPAQPQPQTLEPRVAKFVALYIPAVPEPLRSSRVWGNISEPSGAADTRIIVSHVCVACWRALSEAFVVTPFTAAWWVDAAVSGVLRVAVPRVLYETCGSDGLSIKSIVCVIMWRVDLHRLVVFGTCSGVGTRCVWVDGGFFFFFFFLYLF